MFYIKRPACDYSEGHIMVFRKNLFRQLYQYFELGPLIHNVLYVFNILAVFMM